MLSDRGIRLAILHGELRITPILEDWQLQPASIDLRLGGHVINPLGEQFTIGNEGWLTLKPGDCYLATTLEHVEISRRLVGRLEGKSSIARMFITVHAAGFVDPGFRGQLTLELKNDGPLTVRFPVGGPICQLALDELDGPATRPYGHPDLRSHYQDQEGAVASRLDESVDFDPHI